MEEILSLAKKSTQQAEVFLTSYEETPVIFETNRLKQLHTHQSLVVALRIIREGRVGFSTTTSLDDRSSLVSRAIEVSQFGAPARFELPAAKVYPRVETYDPEIEAFTTEQMIDLGESLLAKVRGHTAELICEAGITKGIVSVRLLNSRGGEASYRKSFFGISLEGNLIRDTDMLFVGDSESSCHLISDPGKVADSVINQLELAKRQASISNEHLPVIFTPLGVASALIAPLALAFNGRIVLQGASPLGEKRGERVFDERLSLWDDATISHRPGSRPCDDEGVPSQSTPLIVGGVVGDFLYDLQTAGLAGVQSTGNGERGEGDLPCPSISSLVFGSGDTSFEEMVGGMEKGLVVEQLMGAEQTNVLGGEFSGNVLLGYKVERGEIVGRVKDTVVSGNVYKVLERLIEIGHEARWVRGTIFTPAFCCSNLKIASKG
ncbi:MAG TPA: metallopeptidase TldD-related protein [Dehalococcoidia bacterium]|nr:metallopeptidase TldD-related protein [Dehalococcoidia bacterium]